MKRTKALVSLLLCLLLLTASLLPVFAEATAAPFDNSRYYENGDYSVHYRVFEAESPKGNVFMIHGFALSSYCFEALAKKLCEGGYTCVIADLPDFGYSSRENENTDRVPREDLMHDLMLSISPEPWYVAGHSMGGYIAIAIAQKYPADVKNLLLYGTSGYDGATPAREKLMTNSAFVKVMGRFLGLLSKMKLLVRALLFTASGDFAFAKDYDISHITDPYEIEGTGEGVIWNFASLPATDYEAFPSLAPVLYVNAANDNVIDKNTIRKLRRYLPEGSVDVTLPDGGHLFIESRADRTAELTLDFLAEHE